VEIENKLTSIKELTDMQQFGGWFTNTKPAWEERLENMGNYALEKTGMNRNELKKLLTYLDEQGIIR
jgi:hypothetical protein